MPCAVHRRRMSSLIAQPANEEETMADTCCTLVPYFKVHAGKLGDFKALCDQFVAKTATEP